uniref:Reverse transcriptase zinc-binding domain-containing protein n=1 Tax=Arundo donax TaxID=35708 RepID=A0A0A9AWV2_ARUDO
MESKGRTKVIFFTWTAMHHRILTADNLEKRGWDNNHVCPLCQSENETSWHLLIDCTFTQQVVGYICNWSQIPSPHMTATEVKEVAIWL